MFKRYSLSWISRHFTISCKLRYSVTWGLYWNHVVLYLRVERLGARRKRIFKSRLPVFCISSSTFHSFFFLSDTLCWIYSRCIQFHILAISSILLLFFFWFSQCSPFVPLKSFFFFFTILGLHFFLETFMYIKHVVELYSL